MMHREGKPRRRGDNGAAAVEFALVVPLLFLLLFGIISYGVMLSFRQSLSQAAAEGARAAAVTVIDDDKQDEAYAAVGEALHSFGVGCVGGHLIKGGDDVGSCSISAPGTCTPAASVGVKCVTVELVYEYREHPVVPHFPGLGYVMPRELVYFAQARVS
jgi:Flp pilus assembly pilin Flp